MFLGEQRFAVGDRNTIVIGMDFREGQETVPVAAIFDEGRLERWLHPRDLGQIYVAFELLLAGDFEIEFVQLVTIDHDHPSLLGMGRVNQHALCHMFTP